jgi:CspA family cold shock protein
MSNPEVTAVVTEWNDEEGWGVVLADDAPGEIWVHFSAIEKKGYESLKPGERVAVKVEGPLPYEVEGYRYKATVCRTLG